uniref:Uncharacterized protein n=1 Tax=Arundo donax TaxID=35708 RepID=A0A0A9DSM3_ARUDO
MREPKTNLSSSTLLRSETPDSPPLPAQNHQYPLRRDEKLGSNRS